MNVVLARVASRQEERARAASVSRQTVARIEAGGGLEDLMRALERADVALIAEAEEVLRERHQRCADGGARS